MKKTLLAPLFILSTLSIGVVSTAAVNAASVFECGSTKVDTSVDLSGYAKKYCTSKDSNMVTAILLIVIDFLSVGVGIAVVIGIIFGGITYAMSDGDTSKAKEGQEIITNAIIGLFLFIFLYAGANFLIPGGIFTK